MLNKIIHIVGVLAVFLALGGVRIDTHYCANKIIGNTIFLDLKECCATDQSEACNVIISGCCSDEVPNQDSDENEECCVNLKQVYMLEQDLMIQDLKFKSFENMSDWTSFVVAVNSQLLRIDRETPIHVFYTPPPIVYDREVRFEKFIC